MGWITDAHLDLQKLSVVMRFGGHGSLFQRARLGPKGVSAYHARRKSVSQVLFRRGMI